MENIKIKDTLLYTIIKYFALAMGFGRELINAHSLGPELLGVLGNLILISSYLLYCNLGIIYSMTKECSVLGECKEEKKKIVNSTFSFIVILAVVFMISGIGSFFFSANKTIGIYMALMFIMSLLDQFRTFFVNYYRINDDLKKINKIEVVYQCGSTIAIVVLIKYGLYGVLTGFIIGGILTLLICISEKRNLKLEIDGKVFKRLIKVGLPLLIYNLGYYIFSTVDRMMIIKFLSKTDLGYYTFANQIAKATLVFITSVMFIYYPKALNKLNLNNTTDIDEINKYVVTYDKYIEVIGVVLIVFGSIVIVPFTNIIMTEYVDSINVYRILSISVIANQLSYFVSVFLLSNGKELFLIKLQGISIVIAVILNYIFLKLGMGLFGIALATLITNILYSVLQHISLSKMLYNSTNILGIIKIYGKFVLFSIINILISIYIKEVFIYSVVTILVFLLFYFNSTIRLLKK